MPRLEITEKWLYKYDELSDDAKQKARECLWDINVDYEWWDCTYEDAKNIGCKISAFDLDRNKYCDLALIDGACEIANKILENHGEQCETYKLAKSFLSDWDTLVEKFSDGIHKNVVAEEKEDEFDEEGDKLINKFEKDLSECYASMLQKEYDYLTSEESIIETIRANDYDFDEDGNF